MCDCGRQRTFRHPTPRIIHYPSLYNVLPEAWLCKWHPSIWWSLHHSYSNIMPLHVPVSLPSPPYNPPKAWSGILDSFHWLACPEQHRPWQHCMVTIILLNVGFKMTTTALVCHKPNGTDARKCTAVPGNEWSRREAANGRYGIWLELRGPMGKLRQLKVRCRQTAIMVECMILHLDSGILCNLIAENSGKNSISTEVCLRVNNA